MLDESLLALDADLVNIRGCGHFKDGLITQLSNRLVGRSVGNDYDVLTCHFITLLCRNFGVKNKVVLYCKIHSLIFVLRYINDSYANRLTVYKVAFADVLKCGGHIFLLGWLRGDYHRHGIVGAAAFVL